MSPIYKVVLEPDVTSEHDAEMEIDSTGTGLTATQHQVYLYPITDNCFFGLQIHLDYPRVPPYTGHVCNFAQFEIFANSGMTGGQSIGYANLNNANNGVYHYDRNMNYVTNTFPYNDPGGVGYTRFSMNTVSPSIAQNIGSQNPQNIFKVTIRCISTGWNNRYISLPWTGEPVYYWESTTWVCHTDVHQLRIVNPYYPIGTTGTTYFDGSLSAFNNIKCNACTGERYHEVSGYIKTGGSVPIQDVVVTFSGITETTGLTDANGFYYIYVPDGYTGTATPTKGGYTFSPTSRSYSGSPVTTDLINQNFTGS